MDLDSGLVKRSHHATFDKAWYLQPSQPLAAQLLYDLGLEAEEVPVSETGPDQVLSPVSDHQAQLAPVPWPPSYDSGKSPSKWDVHYQPWVLSLPLWETTLPRTFAVAAACVQALTSAASMIVSEFGIGKEDMAMVYMSPDPFNEAFEE